MTRMPYFSKTEWALLLGAIIVLIFLLAGCGKRPAIPGIRGNVNALVGIPAATVGKSATMLTPAKDTKQAKDAAEEARAQIAFWKARLAVSIEQEKRLVQEERQQWLERACRVLMGLCLLGLFGSIGTFAASFIWPWFERLRYAAIAGAAAAVVVFCIAWYLPANLPWIGIAVAALTIGGVVLLIENSHALGKHAKAAGLFFNRTKKPG